MINEGNSMCPLREFWDTKGLSGDGIEQKLTTIAGFNQKQAIWGPETIGLAAGEEMDNHWWWWWCDMVDVGVRTKMEEACNEGGPWWDKYALINHGAVINWSHF